MFQPSLKGPLEENQNEYFIKNFLESLTLDGPEGRLPGSVKCDPAHHSFTWEQSLVSERPSGDSEIGTEGGIQVGGLGQQIWGRGQHLGPAFLTCSEGLTKFQEHSLCEWSFLTGMTRHGRLCPLVVSIVCCGGIFEL